MNNIVSGTKRVGTAFEMRALDDDDLFEPSHNPSQLPNLVTPHRVHRKFAQDDFTMYSLQENLPQYTFAYRQ